MSKIFLNDSKAALLEKNKHSIILQNLFYVLCGLDTTYIKLGLENKMFVLKVEPEYPSELLKPFESICTNVRIVNKFILKSQYSSDSIIRILSDHLEGILVNFMKKVSENRSKVDNIETLYVIIEWDIKEFEEIRYVIDEIKESEGVQIYNLLEKRRHNSIMHESFYKNVLNACINKIEDEVINWITKGLILSKNFMIKEYINAKGAFDLEDCYWSSKYLVNEKQIPVYLKNDFRNIYKCGKLINLNRNLHNYIDVSNVNVMERGILGLYNYLNDTTCVLLRSEIEYEVSLIHKYIFMSDSSFYFDMLKEVDKGFLSTDRKTIHKLNSIRKIEFLEFKKSEDSLGNIVLKILDSERRNEIVKVYPFLLSLTINYKPRILQLLINKQTFLELELIFRFLFTITGILYFLQKDFRYRFSKIAVNVIKKYLFSLKRENIAPMKDIDIFIENVSLVVKSYLNNLFLTSRSIFVIIAEFIELCMFFINIEHKERLDVEEHLEYENKLISIVERLVEELKKYNYDYMLINFLEECISPKVFMRKNS